MMWIRRFMIDQTSSDYVKFARSKGLTETEIFSKHILRNAIIPIVHGIPMSIVGTLTGAIITERVYAVPGMGKMLTSSINAFDNSLIVALTFIFTALSVLALLLGDILITFVDPRISFVESGGRK
jgi:oligopeptide transport system permease protein